MTPNDTASKQAQNPTDEAGMCSSLASAGTKDSNTTAIQQKKQPSHSFSPTRPILRREYKHTAASPRAKKGLSTRWTPRQDPAEYRRGIERIRRHTDRHAKQYNTTEYRHVQRTSLTPTLTPAEEFFRSGRRRIKTPKERKVEQNPNDNWLKKRTTRPPAIQNRGNGYKDVSLFYSTLSNSWAVQENNLLNLDMNLKL